ncbi:hypothetical protein [Nocardioides sp. R-C-SC26]|uniref:hypothetical protein n=1 Tax=Nocardioides sp. R-C-SC26 TaxID=2870414 RepID=UPI001E5EF925|nr:hypothetical protein [Nocardioides sp. R-C-SC26]
MTGPDVAQALLIGAAVVAMAWGLTHLVPTLRDAFAAPTLAEREDARYTLLGVAFLGGVLVMLVLEVTSR